MFTITSDLTEEKKNEIRAERNQPIHSEESK